MPKLDWSYHRPGCTSCGKTQEFLATHQVQAEVEINAKKQPYQLDKARELLAGAHKLYSAKGKKVVEVDLTRQALSEEDIIKLMLGPTGNLRAPTVVRGKTVVVGFNQEVYAKVLG